MDEEHFLTALALCHTLNVIGNNRKKIKTSAGSDQNTGMDNPAFDFSEDKIEYQASSPDEKALAEACQRLCQTINMN